MFNEIRKSQFEYGNIKTKRKGKWYGVVIEMKIF